MSEDKSAESADFGSTIKEFTKTLPKEQQDFLSAMLWLAWFATAEEEAIKDKFEQSLSSEFDESFKPEQAELLVKYYSGALDVHMAPRFIKATFIR
ncbi:hypothetical protein [Amycolatopsis sp. lyj-109]|uniref:hypothetical protein n=1 Tax=Amycolatopsis sp. lyj-109 TaxID=2789287 RepID=UPI003978AA56